MNTENNNSQEVNEAELQGPGPMLRAAREAQGLTVEEIAARLNLRAHNINDIENETFDPKVSTTFIKGYLKAYARILGITEEQILNAYYRLGIAESKYAQMQSFSQRTQQEAHNTRLTWISYAIATGLLALLVWWWMQKASLEPATSEQLVNETIIPSVEPSMATSELPMAPEADNLLALPDTLSSAIPTTIDSLGASGAAATAEPMVLAPSIAPTPEVASNEPTKIDLANLEVDFIFTNDCWIKVTDANDKTLAIGVKEKNSTLSIKGQGPFKFTIGAPGAVQITYHNRTFNMNQFKASKIARFELPEKE